MAEEMTFLPKAELLTLEELDRVCSAFIRLGVKKLRLTGGEPLVRRNIMALFRLLGRHLGTGALDELTLTTNGSQLARYAGELYNCGVRRGANRGFLVGRKFRCNLHRNCGIASLGALGARGRAADRCSASEWRYGSARLLRTRKSWAPNAVAGDVSANSS